MDFKKKNFFKLLNFSKKIRVINYINGLKNQKNFYSKKNVLEMYLPRLTYANYLEEKTILSLNKANNKKIQIDFLKGG